MKIYPLYVIGNHTQNGSDKPEIYGIVPSVENIGFDNLSPAHKVIVRFTDEPDNPQSTIYNREVVVMSDDRLYAFE